MRGMRQEIGGEGPGSSASKARRRRGGEVGREEFWSGLYRRLVDQHHRNVVPDGVHAFALVALEGGAVVDEFYRGLAVGTGQDFQQFGVDGHRSSGIRKDYNILK